MAPPTATEVYALSRGVESAIAPPGGVTETQQLLMRAIFVSMTTFPATLGAPAMTAAELALTLSDRTHEFRNRIVQIMVLLSLVLRPLPPRWRTASLPSPRRWMWKKGWLRWRTASRRGASVSLRSISSGTATRRNGCPKTRRRCTRRASWPRLGMPWWPIHRWRRGGTPWNRSPTKRWVGGSPSSTELAASATRGCPVPRPPLLAQHDWVHVLADYGTTVESELEVFAFIARANDDMRAFSLLAMVVSLFETGYLRTGAGLFESSPGHLSERGMATRVGDAMRRGAECRGSIDYLRTDWFDLAELRVEDAGTTSASGPKRRPPPTPARSVRGNAVASAHSRYRADPLWPWPVELPTTPTERPSPDWLVERIWAEVSIWGGSVRRVGMNMSPDVLRTFPAAPVARRTPPVASALMTEAPEAISAEGLVRRFDDSLAVDHVDLQIATGEIYGFLGPNGAGKSTTVRMLCTLLAPTGGRALVAGYDVATHPGQVRLRIGVALQEAALDPKQTGVELLRLQGRLYGLSAARRGPASLPSWPNSSISVMRSTGDRDLLGRDEAAARPGGGARSTTPRSCSSTSRPPGWIP